MAEQLEERFLTWLASAPSSEQILDTIEIFHPKFGTIRLVNSSDSFTTKDETGSSITFDPGDFQIEFATVEFGTGNVVNAAINGGNGQIYKALKNLTFNDRMTPIKVIYRPYIVGFDQPLIIPPPVYEVANASGANSVVNFELAFTFLANKLKGLYYSKDEFPDLPIS